MLASPRSTSDAACPAAPYAPITTLDEALAYGAATDQRVGRRRTIAALRADGVSVLDTTAAQLMTHLVNHHWETKRAGAA